MQTVQVTFFYINYLPHPTSKIYILLNLLTFQATSLTEKGNVYIHIITF